MFHVHRSPAGLCEIRFDFQDRSANEIAPEERRAFIHLSFSLEVVNVWLATLGVDCRYATTTVYEYTKALVYTLEWLAQEPVNLATQEPVGHSLLGLSRSDLRSLFAWLDIPASRPEERASLAKKGMLPAGYRQHLLSSSTRNLRNAALTCFYDWIFVEYSPPAGITVELSTNPMKDVQRPLSRRQLQLRPDGLLPRSTQRKPEASSLFRRAQADKETGPIALTPHELHLVLEAIPAISCGRNAANRNGALIRLLLWGMLRKEELTQARWEDIDGEILWVTGKGRKRRSIPIADPSTWSYLHAYTSDLSIPGEQRFHGPLLRQLDHEDRPITRHTVEHLMDAFQQYFLAQAEQKARSNDPTGARAYESLANKLHSHLFRATGATYLAKAGMNLLMLALLLGHSDPSTTMRYYIAAKQLALPEEVKRMYAGIAATLETASASPSSHGLPNPRSWYQRRGLMPEE